MENKPIALVLGGTSPHIELINRLKKRGYYTVLVDYLDNPPAKAVADQHVQESTLDLQKVLETARTFDAKLVISAAVDQANITACYVAEQMRLTKPYSYEFADRITDKGYMKKIMVANGIPTSRYIYIDRGESVENFDLSLPVMVKPADSCAASGVKKACSTEEMRKYLIDAQRISRSGRAVIEEFKTGVEVSVYGFVFGTKVQVLFSAQRLSVIDGVNHVVKCYSTISPMEISETATEKLKNTSQQIADAFCLKNTPLLVQAIVNEDDVSIIEFAPRMGGGMSYETIKMGTGFRHNGGNH